MNKTTPLLLSDLLLPNPEGVVLVDKPLGKTSFSLVSALRRMTRVRTIGHAGTLDPLATGLMILLVGRGATRHSNLYLKSSKQYTATFFLGAATTTYDAEGTVTATSSHIPSSGEVERTLASFQGTIHQIPPMFSAKKHHGKPLYHFARKGEEIPRNPVPVTVALSHVTYNYPHLSLTVDCSSGTYIRSLAHDVGHSLGCGAHLIQLRRVRCGNFCVEEALPGHLLYKDNT